jgi:hypothetical protein
VATPSDLASLDAVKAWLGNTAVTSDAMLSGLITSVSRTILAYINRSFILPASRNEVRDGTGGRTLMLRDWPVIAVQSLLVNGSAIPVNSNPPLGSGFILEQASPYPPGAMQRLTLPSQLFSRGLSNVSITYTAGYQVTGEAWTIPGTPFQVTALGPYGDWATDQGVTYVSGTPLVPVPSGPARGQYSVSAGKYTFAAADAGLGVLISYGYVPSELKQACIEAVGERFKARDRIGIQSKTLASQETITYTTKDLPEPIKMMLSSYKSVVTP